MRNGLPIPLVATTLLPNQPESGHTRGTIVYSGSLNCCGVRSSWSPEVGMERNPKLKDCFVADRIFANFPQGLVG